MDSQHGIHSQAENADSRSALSHIIEHCAHLLPAQGPITSFVHHNTLHAYEEMGFAEGVAAGSLRYGCEPYLPEGTYRNLLSRGRIRVADLEAILARELGPAGGESVAGIEARSGLRLAILQFPFLSGSHAELHWVMANTDALRSFCSNVKPSIKDKTIAAIRSWVEESVQTDAVLHASAVSGQKLLFQVADQVQGNRSFSHWDEAAWERYSVNLIWQICHDGVRKTQREPEASRSFIRHRDLLLAVGAEDIDLQVQATLIPFCAAYLDQGYATWSMPHRDDGLYQAFLSIYGEGSAAPTRWARALQKEARRVLLDQRDPLDSIKESLSKLGVSPMEREAFLRDSLLVLRGWAGMIWQMETNAEWAPRPARAGALVEFLAVQLILERIALEQVAKSSLGYHGPLDQLRSFAADLLPGPSVNGADQLTFLLYQLAQFQAWNAQELWQLSIIEWSQLVEEIRAFPELERRRVLHQAYEQRFRHVALDAVSAHFHRLKRDPLPALKDSVPEFQVVCCIDDREESFRRHLEEIAPDCETFGVAGFFGTAMYYRSVSDAHFKPLCPAAIKPKHYVTEEPTFSMMADAKIRASARKQFGRATHQAHLGSRGFLGGVLTTLAGSLAAFPLVTRTLFPWTASRIRRAMTQMVTPTATELRIERLEHVPGPSGGHLGYSLDEMATIVSNVLHAMGLTSRWSKLVAFIGHGSTSLNNPHESAYSCGACSGNPGGPNARAFAFMANDLRVRKRLADQGFMIPEDTYFVGGYHDTTNDSVTFADLDRLPFGRRPDFERLRDAINEARERNAHERCRRFESADLTLSPREALRHVESRPEDLSQARPEYNHATNALCFVGKRSWSRGLFLDRRAFLTSYDPQVDDAQGTILEKLLQAVIPVCAGISLEYYFSTVDTEGYGCGSKLPHNITSLLGVMTGAASDLKPGLSAQMTEIHEPMRILFLVETTQPALRRILESNVAIRNLVEGEWVHLAIIDSTTGAIQQYLKGDFVLYEPENHDVPHVTSSINWYRGSRDHLGFASILQTIDGRQVPK